MTDIIERAAQMIAELAKLENSLRLAAAERDALRLRVAELEPPAAGEVMRVAVDLEQLGLDHDEFVLVRRDDWGRFRAAVTTYREEQEGGKAASDEKQHVPYLRELPSGDFERVCPAGWPVMPGPTRPNIIRRRDVLRGGS